MVHSEVLEQSMANRHQTAEELCRTHVTSVMEAMLSDAGFEGNDPEVTRKAYGRFEAAIRDIRKHLIGIKEQNVFLLKSRSPV